MVGFNARNSCSAHRARNMIMKMLVASCVVALFVLAGCSSSTAKGSFDAYSWSELSSISKEIAEAESDSEALEIAERYHLVNSSGKLDGKTKSVALSDGTKAAVAIAGIRQDDLASGGKAGITCVFTSAPAVCSMNDDASNVGGWEKSKMRSWLNGEFLDLLPGDLKGVISAAKKKTNSSGGTTPGSVSTTSDKLWLPSLVEVAGSVSPNDLVGGSGIPAATFNAEGKQYQAFAQGAIGTTRTFVGDDSKGSGIVVAGEASPWWQRSLSTTWTAGFSATDAEGDAMSAWFSDYALAVAPGFCL